MSEEEIVLAPRAPAGRLNKPGLATRFHIDFDWWQREEREIEVYLRTYLSEAQLAQLQQENAPQTVDWVDPETAEVRNMNLMEFLFRTNAAELMAGEEKGASLVDAIFRLFLANGNQSLSPVEIAEKVGRAGQERTILRTLSGARVYKGIRPVD